MTPTKAQKQAIESKGNLIVSAAAGSGKTSVLTERIVRLIVDEHVSVDRFLVLTFTKAAASEMRQRILDRLQRELRTTGNPEEKVRLLHEVNALSTANISTIDSFCTRILKRHGHSIGIDSNIRVADTVELAVLTEQAKDSFLCEIAENNNPDYHTLLEAFQGEEHVWNCMQSFNRFLDICPEPDEWAELTLAKAADPNFNAYLLDEYTNYLVSELSPALNSYILARNSLPVKDNLKNALTIIDNEIMQFRALLLLNNYDAYRNNLDGIQFSRLTFPKDTDSSDKERIKSSRDTLKALRKKQLEDMTKTAEEEFLLQNQSCALLSSLFHLSLLYREFYQSLKQKRGICDFTDIEHFALKILSEDRIAEEYKEKFLYIAVDEYQDSNRVQEKLLQYVSRGNNIFMVGDVKQSIYRFRAAEPNLFLEKLDTYDGNAGKRIDLNENFRSSNAVIRAVNCVFSAIMNRQTGGLDYDDRAALHYSSDVPCGSAELHLIHGNVESTDDSETTNSKEIADALDIDNAELEAQFIASKISELLENGQCYDVREKKMRSFRISDFTILLRTNSQAQVYAETLSRFGIPCYAQASGDYFDAIEVTILLNCLRVIDNRKQDIPLISILRSPLFGFTSDELAKIRMLQPKKPFYDVFFSVNEMQCKENNFSELYEKIKQTIDFLDTLYEESQICDVSALLLKVIDGTGYYEKMGVLPAGHQRQINVDALLERARIFEDTGARGVFKFLKSMDAASNESNLGSAQEASGDVLRILSIHRSKGLEFPVVFLAQTAKKFNMRENGSNAVFDSEFGAGIRFCRDDYHYNTIGRKAILKKQKLNALAEEMRILYVAMTRAKQSLYIVASGENACKPYLEKAELPLANKVANMLPWLLTGNRLNEEDLPVFVHKKEDIVCGFRVPQTEKNEQISCEHTDFHSVFNFNYPYADATALPSKQSVSDVAHRQSNEEMIRHLSFNPPAFISESDSDAAFRGTISHLILETVPKTFLSAEELQCFLQNALETGILMEKDLSCIQQDDILWYLQTDLWKRSVNSSVLKREWRFTLSVPASDVFDTAANENILLQGVIDCCFLENDKWILIDYKTDRLYKDENPSEHAETHRSQLTIYAKALEKLTGKLVSESYVVLLSDHTVVKL